MKCLNRLLFLAVIVPALLLPACRSTKKDQSSEVKPDQASATAGEMTYVARVDAAPFYRYGPAQAGSPDWKVQRGQEVTILSLGKDYSRAKLPSGLVGWVNTSDFQPKEGSRLAANSSPTGQSSAGAVSGEESFVPPTDPGGETPLPEPVAPPPGIPEFRL